MKLSRPAFVVLDVLDVLHGLVPDDDSLIQMLQLGRHCAERGLSFDEEWQAVGELSEANLIESEIHEFGPKTIRYFGFTSRARAEELLYASTPPDASPRSRPSALAERLLVNA